MGYRYLYLHKIVSASRNTIEIRLKLKITGELLIKYARYNLSTRIISPKKKKLKRTGVRGMKIIFLRLFPLALIISRLAQIFLRCDFGMTIVITKSALCYGE